MALTVSVTQAQAQTVVVPVEVAPHDDPPPVYRRANVTPIVGGVVLFGVSYGAAVIVAASTDSDANDRLYVPLLGPWLAMGDRGDCPVQDAACDSETSKKILLGVDGVLQATGAIVLVYGLLSPRSYTKTTVAGRDVDIVPVAMQGGGRGFGLTGSF
jgi:hypothetical protein